MSRRADRDLVQSTWQVYDATRPVRRTDFAASESADGGAVSVLAPQGDAPVESSAPSGVAVAATALRACVWRMLARAQ